MRLYPLVVTLLLIGCGEAQRPEETAADWASKAGPTWEAYEQGFRTGWTEGCEAASDRIKEEQPALSTANLCGHAPSSPDESVQTPAAPPDDPEGEGHSDGLIAGCENAYSVAGREDELDICGSGEMFG